MSTPASEQTPATPSASPETDPHPASSTEPSQPSQPSQPTQPSEPPAQPAPRSRYSMGSTANMARSLVVILAFVAVLIAIVPRVSQVDQPAVDAQAVVQDAVRTSGLAFEAPVGLPSGWKATSARYGKSTDDIVTWQAGWTTPSGGFVGIREADKVTAKWLTTVTNEGEVTGAVDAGGRTWEKRYDAAHDQTSLVDQHDGGLTTVVTATAPDSEIQTFTNLLKPATSS